MYNFFTALWEDDFQTRSLHISLFNFEFSWDPSIGPGAQIWPRISKITNSSIEVLEKRILNNFTLYFCVKLGTPLGAPDLAIGIRFKQYYLQFTLYEDAYIVISQIVAFEFLRRRFIYIFPIYFSSILWNPLRAQYQSRIAVFTI